MSILSSDPSLLDREIALVLAQGRVSSFELIQAKKDRTEIEVVSNSSLIEYDGAPAILSVHHDVSVMKRLSQEREKLIQELQMMLTHLKTLSGLLPICSNCKKIRDDSGYWQAVEEYVMDHSDAQFTHGICPDCMKRLYPGYAAKMTAGEKDRPAPPKNSSTV
jgi:hypothetical protein